MRHYFPFAIVILCAGCRDSADMLSRDFRNLNNEAIDALMMITDESSAKTMLERVIKQYPKKLQLVDDRCKNWKQNNEKDDYGSQIWTSDSVAILIVETEMNKQRLALEEARLAKLLKQLKSANPSASLPGLGALLGDEGNETKRIHDQLEGKEGGEVIKILQEINKDEKLLKNGRMKNLKDAFDVKLQDFKTNRILKLNGVG
jgi:type I site-specific restriction-modification system R (restriction) subunit